MFEQLGLIGCGLMGGSFALAVKRAGWVQRVVGYSHSPETTQRARQIGVVDDAASSALQAAAGSDLVLIAVPVAATQATLEAIAPAVTPGMLIMDVGSTKQEVVALGRRVLQDKAGCWVPAHPIAGKEVSGIEHADADLYTGRQVIITPTDCTLPRQLQQAIELWTGLGCRVQTMTAQAHDAAFAAVSHLPHLIAFAFMNAVTGQATGPDWLSLAGPGFRDFTRIAASDPQVWRDIMLSNREQLLAQSQFFKSQLAAVELMIANGDGQALQALISQASRARADWCLDPPQR